MIMKIKKYLLSVIAMLLFSGMAFSQIVVSVDPALEVGPIKPMNAANNGPNGPTFKAYKALRVPYGRTHDTPLGEVWSSHVVDINQIFPDWNANVNNPKSYDFDLTDEMLQDMIKAGTEPFFRLGQSIEHESKKYGIYPPKDYKKWAKICEHIIRHYTEGWADGHKWDITYWEIWNEPDLDDPDDRWKTDPRTWGGTQEQFYELYEVTAKHLKKCFPHLKIGGPAFANPRKYGPPFLDYLKKTNTPIDFFSWHMYHRRPVRVSEDVHKVREILDEKGFTNVESILNEWNYNKSWTEKNYYSRYVRRSIKAAAFMAGVMSECQNGPVDMLMYYDLRPNTTWNGAFMPHTYDILPAYWALYYWAELVDYGTQVKSSCEENDIYTCAAKSADGKVRLIVVRYHETDAEQDIKPVSLSVPAGMSVTEVRLTDSERMNQTIEVDKSAPVLQMERNSVALIEMK